MNANLVFKWLRDERFANAMPPEFPDDHDELQFLPVEIVSASTEADVEYAALPKMTSSSSPDTRLEIDLAGGHCLRVIGPYDAEALAILIRRLSA